MNCMPPTGRCQHSLRSFTSLLATVQQVPWSHLPYKLHAACLCPWWQTANEGETLPRGVSGKRWLNNDQSDAAVTPNKVPCNQAGRPQPKRTEDLPPLAHWARNLTVRSNSRVTLNKSFSRQLRTTRHLNQSHNTQKAGWEQLPSS